MDLQAAMNEFAQIEQLSLEIDLQYIEFDDRLMIIRLDHLKFPPINATFTFHTTLDFITFNSFTPECSFIQFNFLKIYLPLFIHSVL